MDNDEEDILTRLKRHRDDPDLAFYAGDMIEEAIDEIEYLRKIHEMTSE